jgi:hypothetical protein
MKVLIEKPPNFDAIDAAFHLTERGAKPVFAYGSVIYNPWNVEVPPYLVAHELVHGARQKDDIEGWWRRYIDDAQFRLKEEVQAHKAELACVCQRVKDRNRRARLLHITALRLASPLYGGVISYTDAVCLLRG